MGYLGGVRTKRQIALYIRPCVARGRADSSRHKLGDVIYEPDEFYPEFQTLSDLAKQVALETEGYTGAEIIAICNESKLLAFNNFFKDNDGAKKDCITPQLVFQAAKPK